MRPAGSPFASALEQEVLMAFEASAIRSSSPAFQAYQILHVAFTIAPIVAGVDKFFHVLVNWDQYLSPMVSNTLNVAPHTFMLGVGVIEIVAGLLVAFMPVIGAWIVGAWLCGIIVNLLSIPGYFDVALRDFGLALAAFAFARLADQYAARG
jgi:hypothetical protein